jgi:hypothetical protein
MQINLKILDNLKVNYQLNLEEETKMHLVDLLQATFSESVYLTIECVVVLLPNPKSDNNIIDSIISLE